MKKQSLIDNLFEYTRKGLVWAARTFGLFYIPRIAMSILPPRCPVTGEIVGADAMISPSAWAEFRFITDPKCGCCGVPFSFTAEKEITTRKKKSNYQCPDCLATPPYFDTARAPLAYDDGSRKLILSFKHGDQQHCAKIMARLMVRVMENQSDLLEEESALILPVPLHFRKLVWRRFNQSGLLAQNIAKLTGLEYAPNILLRTRHTPPQKDKNNAQRKANVKRAFAVPDKKARAVKGRRVIVVDDVYTTGATVNECARILRKAGAAKVDILTFARTVRD